MRRTQLNLRTNRRNFQLDLPYQPVIAWKFRTELPNEQVKGWVAMSIGLVMRSNLGNHLDSRLGIHCRTPEVVVLG